MRILAILLLTAAAALAQLDTDTITIVVRSPSTSVPPGSLAVNVQVYAAAGTSLDDVLAVASGAGATERDLLGVDVSCIPSGLPVGRACPFTWRFQFTAPLTGVKDTLAKLARLGGGKSGTDVSYSVYSADTSAPPDCAYPTLISQARRYAENVATAAGVRVGRVVALADAPAVDNVIPTAAIRVYDPLAGIPVGAVFSSFLLGPPAPAIRPTCGVAVQFQLAR